MNNVSYRSYYRKYTNHFLLLLTIDTVGPYKLYFKRYLALRSDGDTNRPSATNTRIRCRDITRSQTPVGPVLPVAAGLAGNASLLLFIYITGVSHDLD